MIPKCNKCGSTKLFLISKGTYQNDFEFNEERQEWVAWGWDNLHTNETSIKFYCSDCEKYMSLKAYEKLYGKINWDSSIPDTPSKQG